MQQLQFKTSTSKVHLGLPPTFKLNSQTSSDLQTRFADLHAPTFKLDSPINTLQVSNSIGSLWEIINLLSWISKGVACEIRSEHEGLRIEFESRSVKVCESSLKVGGVCESSLKVRGSLQIEFEGRG